ncbi:MAG: RND family transporter [Candidatus Kuenenia sp.]|nr:RND family transporter [Candidatus Kuenenia hertensis]
MKKYLHILLKYRIAILVCILIITAFLGFCAKGMKTDNSIEIWLSKDDKDLEYYKEFLKKFGDEEFLVVAFSAVNLFNKEYLRQISTLAEKIKDLEGIVRVASLADVFKNKITSPPFKEKMKKYGNRSVMNIFKQEVRNDPVYQNTIISKNGRTTAIIATVKCAGPEARKKLVADVKKVLQETTIKPADTKNEKRHPYHLAGPSVVNAELDRMSKRDMGKFIPLMSIISIAVLGCLFRNISGVLIPVLTVGVCVTWVTGIFVLMGQTMNMIANMLLPLTFIISLSTTIRTINYYYHERRIYETLLHVSIPILMASVTTAIGFASLTTSNIPPVFTTGLFMSGCAILSYAVSITFVPILLSFIPLQREHSMNISSHDKYSLPLFFKIGKFTVKNKTAILSAGIAIFIVSIIGITRLKLESDLMTSFPKDSSIARDNNYIEKHLMGLLPVEIVAETPYGTSIFQPDILNNVVMLQKYLNGIPEITHSISIADYIQKTHQILNNNKTGHCALPASEKQSADYIKLASMYGDKYVDTLYTQEHSGARVSVRMKQVGSNKYQSIIQSIKEFIRNHLNTASLSWHITGIVPLLINVQDNILWSEIQSFSLAFILMFIATAVVLKSVRIGLISVIPNLIPITVTLGLMGFAGMRLDAATIMIASIALGISVDDTIHIFYRFRKELSLDANYQEAICRTMFRVGRAAVFTSVTAACGFMVFSFSNFKPIQYFGVLTGITMLSALVSDLLLSPSCLMLLKPKNIKYS